MFFKIICSFFKLDNISIDLFIVCKLFSFVNELYDIEIICVDDGSTDETFEVVKGFYEEHKIKIRYYKKINGGKHTAINQGAELAEGELFWILDSDDSLPKDALSVVVKCWNSIDRSQKENLAGICGYMAHHDGKVIGSPIVEAGTIVSTLEMRHKLHITGDMMEVWRTDVMREFPFPEIPNERFCSEALIWNRIATKYPLYMILDVIYYRDYLDGGLTANIVKIRMKSPIASMMTYAEWFDYNIPFADKVRNAINYWRFAFCAKKRDVKINGWGILLAPLGYLMYLNDKRKIKL